MRTGAEKTLLLCSGGVESAVLVAQLLAARRHPVPLFADYSQRGAQRERIAARAVCASFEGVPPPQELDLRAEGGRFQVPPHTPGLACSGRVPKHTPLSASCSRASHERAIVSFDSGAASSALAIALAGHQPPSRAGAAPQPRPPLPRAVVGAPRALRLTAAARAAPLDSCARGVGEHARLLAAGHRPQPRRFWQGRGV